MRFEKTFGTYRGEIINRYYLTKLGKEILESYGRFASPVRKKVTWLKKRYHIAQQYLRENSLPEIDYPSIKANNPEKIRSYFIAILQSLAAEQELKIPHSEISMHGIKEFAGFFLKAIRWKAIDHLYWHDFSPLLSEKISENEEELHSIVKRMGKGGWGRDLISNWAKLIGYLGESNFYDIFWDSVIADDDIKDQWVDLEELISSYLKRGYWVIYKRGAYGEWKQFKLDNPVILFEKIRNLEHQSDFVLREYIFPNDDEEEKLYDYFLNKKWIEQDQPVNVYLMFMDKLAEDAFEFEIWYDFGVSLETSETFSPELINRVKILLEKRRPPEMIAEELEIPLKAVERIRLRRPPEGLPKWARILDLHERGVSRDKILEEIALSGLETTKEYVKKTIKEYKAGRFEYSPILYTWIRKY